MKVKATLTFEFDTKDDPDMKDLSIDEIRQYMNKEISEPMIQGQGVVNVKLFIEEVTE